MMKTSEVEKEAHESALRVCDSDNELDIRSYEVGYFNGFLKGKHTAEFELKRLKELFRIVWTAKDGGIPYKIAKEITEIIYPND